MIKRNKEHGILRIFDPLQYPDFDKTDCILNLTVFLENDGLRRMDNGYREPTDNKQEMENLKRNIDFFDKSSHSIKKDFSMKLVISVNGHLMDDESINYLKSLDRQKLNDSKVEIIIYQRPNIGWQWGSLWDIWTRWKNVNCEYWVSKECDWHFRLENWYDILKEKLISNKNAAFVSAYERKFKFDPYEYYGPLSIDVWRDINGKPFKAKWEDVKHVQPSYYFMRKSFLEKMDKTFGCFTYALGQSYELDAIVYGEMGFSQKTKALGYSWVEFYDLTNPDN